MGTVYSAVRLLFLCVQCIMQWDCYWYVYSEQSIETVIGMFTVYSAVRLLFVCVQSKVQ